MTHFIRKKLKKAQKEKNGYCSSIEKRYKKQLSSETNVMPPTQTLMALHRKKLYLFQSRPVFYHLLSQAKTIII